MIHDLLKKKLDNIAKELGAKVDYRSCEDEYSTWREITIEYDHDLKESEQYKYLYEQQKSCKKINKESQVLP